MLGLYPAGSEPIGSAGTVAAAPGDGGSGSGDNYIRCTLATHAGQLQLNLATLDWALFAQLSPAAFAAPVAKGTHRMTAGSAELVIAVAAASIPKGWYMLALSDGDRTTTVLCPVQVS